jgi:hypothetical protein
VDSSVQEFARADLLDCKEVASDQPVHARMFGGFGDGFCANWRVSFLQNTDLVTFSIWTMTLTTGLLTNSYYAF